MNVLIIFMEDVRKEVKERKGLRFPENDIDI